MVGDDNIDTEGISQTDFPMIGNTAIHGDNQLAMIMGKLIDRLFR
jgi:hypothetical protein